MKHQEFYTKNRTTHHSTINQKFCKGNLWQIILLVLVAVLSEPLIIFKYQNSVPISFKYYLRLLEYCALIVIPFISFFLWLNWREFVKQNSGYDWVGKFEVIKKQSSFIFCYLLLAPGNIKLKVERSLFDKTRIGNAILIRRNALGTIEEIKKINNLSNRLTRIRARRGISS